MDIDVPNTDSADLEADTEVIYVTCYSLESAHIAQ